MDSLLILLTIGGLLLLNGLFVAAEFALLATSRTAVEQLADRGNRWARIVQRILEEPRQQDRLIATAQLGITLASLGLGMYGEHALAERMVVWFEALGDLQLIAAHSLASIVAVGVLAYLHLVLGEMVPKSIALGRPLRAALIILPIVQALRYALWPLVTSIEWVGNRVLKMMGITRRQHYYTTEELAMIVAESEKVGLLEKESGRVLRDLFEFGERMASEVMVPRVAVVGIPIGCTPDKLRDMLRTARHTRYPVYKGDLDHVLGMLHVKDLFRFLREGRTIEAGAARPVPFVPETTRLDQVLDVIQKHRTHMAVVMDEHGGTAGIVTVEDLFEEVVGEIHEDASQAHITHDEDGAVVAAGTVRLDELGEALGVELEHEEADTISGLVLMLLERPARQGDVVHWRDLRLEVIAVEGRGVRMARVTRLPPAAGGEAAPQTP